MWQVKKNAVFIALAFTFSFVQTMTIVQIDSAEDSGIFWAQSPKLEVMQQGYWLRGLRQRIHWRGPHMCGAKQPQPELLWQLPPQQQVLSSISPTFAPLGTVIHYLVRSQILKLSSSTVMLITLCCWISSAFLGLQGCSRLLHRTQIAFRASSFYFTLQWFVCSSSTLVAKPLVGSRTCPVVEQIPALPHSQSTGKLSVGGNGTFLLLLCS